MKNSHLFTDNSNLHDADKAVRDFLKGHGKNLTDEEHDELGELLNQRAEAISEVLGVEVGSVVSLRKKNP